MNQTEYGLVYKSLRGFLRIVTPRFEVEPLPEYDDPVVFVSHHQNLKGPFYIHLWLTEEQFMRTWVFSNLYDQEDCYDHYVNYTFTDRFGLPEWLAKIIAYPASYYVSALMKSGRGIPVYRKSRKIIDTFKETAEAMRHGEDILIFPDVDYSSDEDEVSDIYQGFLNIEKYYYRNTQRHVNFVPLLAVEGSRRIVNGSPIRFEEGIDFIDQRADKAKELQESMNHLLQEHSM